MMNISKEYEIYIIIKKFNKHSLDIYYSQCLCRFLILNNKKRCIFELFNNYNFFYEVKDIKKNVNLCIKKQKTFIENLVIIVAIIPFLKYNNSIYYKNNNRFINELLKYGFTFNYTEDNKIIMNINDFDKIKNEFDKLINYKWELIPSHKVLDNLRYIINNYYDDSCLNIFEESLNNNYNYYIRNNIHNLSKNEIKKLLSKLPIFLLFNIRKYWNFSKNSMLWKRSICISKKIY